MVRVTRRVKVRVSSSFCVCPTFIVYLDSVYDFQLFDTKFMEIWGGPDP